MLAWQGGPPNFAGTDCICSCIWLTITRVVYIAHQKITLYIACEDKVMAANERNILRPDTIGVWTCVQEPELEEWPRQRWQCRVWLQ